MKMSQMQQKKTQREREHHALAVRIDNNTDHQLSQELVSFLACFSPKRRTQRPGLAHRTA